MRKNISKLVLALVGILLAATLMVGASYAWLTMSTSPVANGINVTIGGGNTILLAPDITKKVMINEEGETVTVHYPGEFTDLLNLSQYETYSYMKSLGGVKPVSTADGIHWIIPTYDEDTERLNPVSQFTVDTSYRYANLETVDEGSYVCLDFWMVSPGSEYDIRVSTDVDNGMGSYLLELPSVITDEEGKLTLDEPQGIIQTSTRIGFLVNKTKGTEESQWFYKLSEHYQDRYQNLAGRYPEYGENSEAYSALNYDFTIYEPNATVHPAEELEDGSYIITKPLTYDEEEALIREERISDRVTVQTASTWRMLGESLQLEQIFQTSIAGKTDLNESTAADIFYREYLQEQVATYVQTGNFITNTDRLYDLAAGRNVSASIMQEQLTTAGATEDIIITSLERNVPQRIRMFIWLEGQDADCVNTESIKSTAFSLSLELAGATKQ